MSCERFLNHGLRPSSAIHPLLVAAEVLGGGTVWAIQCRREQQGQDSHVSWLASWAAVAIECENRRMYSEREAWMVHCLRGA
jgi:hypothetical protein